MKQCPNCQTVYDDDSLRFCLNDGANLIDTPGEAATVQMSFDKSPMRVNIAPADTTPTYNSPPVFAAVPPPPEKKSSVGLIVAGIVGLLLLLVVGGLAAFFALRPANDKNSAVVISSPPPTASPTASIDETAKLREEMANLQKQLQDQKNQKKNSPVASNSGAPTNSSAAPKNFPTTARANSPGDGFLALRDEPSAQTGYQIAKIPHGAIVTVVACPKNSNVGKTPGRWCQVVYNGQSGWAFDAYMTF